MISVIFENKLIIFPVNIVISDKFLASYILFLRQYHRTPFYSVCQSMNIFIIF